MSEEYVCFIYFSEFNCSWLVFASIKGIADSHLNSLGIYKKFDCLNENKVVYHNEENGLYLFRQTAQDKSWMVNISIFMFLLIEKTISVF